MSTNLVDTVARIIYENEGGMSNSDYLEINGKPKKIWVLTNRIHWLI